MTDLHIRPTGRAASRVAETNMLTARALRAVAHLRPPPDAVIITGDLTELGLASEYAVLRAMLGQQLRLPTYVIPGNHDDRDRMLQELPWVRAHAGFIQYAVEDLPLRLVMLDTLVPGEAYGRLCPARLEWLDRTLAEAPNKPTLIGMHHPPFATGIGHMDKIGLLEPEGFIAIVSRHSQVERIVCGHHHRPVIARVGSAVATICPSVAHQVELDLADDAPSAFVLEPAMYQIHRWREATGVATHTAFVENYPGPFPFLWEPGGEA